MIRRLDENDVSALLEIENLCFSHPYNHEQYLYELNDNPCAYLYGYFIDNQLVGFIDYWITFDCAQLCKIATHPDFQNRGIGKEMMEFMYKDAIKQDCENVLLEVRVSNEKAIDFYHHEDFLDINIRSKYYSEPVEDAIVMGKILVGIDL